MKKYLFLLAMASFMAFSKIGHAQTTFKFGPEMGIGISQFSKENSYVIQSRNDQVKEKRSPVYGPLLGFTTELTVNKYFQFNAGLQYQKTGERYYYHRDGNDLLYNATYQSETWEDQTFHKLCLPLSAGLTLKAWKFQPAVFVGYRPNFFLSGKNSYKFNFDHEDPARDEDSKIEFNPVNVEFPFRKFRNQFFLGVSSNLGQQLKISLIYNSGKEILYQEGNYPGCRPYSFKNNDFLFSIAYLFSAPERSVK